MVSKKSHIVLAGAALAILILALVFYSAMLAPQKDTRTFNVQWGTVSFDPQSRILEISGQSKAGPVFMASVSVNRADVLRQILKPYGEVGLGLESMALVITRIFDPKSNEPESEHTQNALEWNTTSDGYFHIKATIPKKIGKTGSETLEYFVYLHTANGSSSINEGYLFHYE